MPAPRRERRPFRLLAGTALSLATAALAIWASVHSLGAASTGEGRLWLPPTPGGEQTLAEQRFAARQKLTPADLAAIRRLAVRSPQAAEPFAWAGYAALLRGDAKAATPLLEEAKARSPRSRLARMALMQIHATQGNVDALAVELVPLLRLEPELVRPLTEQWVKTAKSPRDVALLAKMLRSEPAIYAQVAEAAARGRSDPALLAAFLANSPLADGAEAARVNRALLMALVEQGEVAAARAAWQAQTPGNGAASRAGLLYNGDFADQKSPPPFNWDLSSGRDGVAEYHRDGGVFVDYFGRGGAPFVRQLLSLAPGSYRLSVRQQAEGGGGLAWAVVCAGAGAGAGGGAGKATLLDRTVPGANSALDARFTVPAGCRAQWLMLEGRGELRRGDGQRLLVNRVTLERVGAR